MVGSSEVGKISDLQPWRVILERTHIIFMSVGLGML